MCGKERNASQRWGGGVLSPTALDRIVSYKYKPGTYTWLDNQLTPFWNWTVTLLPRSMAPNLVTFTGLLLVSMSSAVLTAYSPRLDSIVPSWVYGLFAISIFAYQTLDAIDGKQARRTNSSSPLGQLFDHGCDTIVKVLTTVAMAACLQMGSTWMTTLIFTSVEAVFYAAQWEEYHTGTLNWSNGLFGVTETQYLQIGVLLITALFGEDVWVMEIPLSRGWTVRGVLTVVTFLLATWMVGAGASRVWRFPPENLPPTERGRKTTGVGLGVVQLLPMALVMLMSFLMSSGPGFPLFERRTVGVMFTLGLVSTYLTSRLIVHHMTKSPLLLGELACPPVVALALTTANTYWNTWGLGSGGSPVDPELALAICGMVTLAFYLHYVVSVIRDICDRLGILCFQIGHSRVD